MKHYDRIIIGAGLCGLSASYHLEKARSSDYLMLERNHEVGGLARTETYDGFSFDHSIHILFTRDPYVADLICEKLLVDNFEKLARESYCYTAGVYTEYPYQANNFGLPPETIAANILGLIESRYASSYDGPPPHFESWIYRTFGRGIAEHFMIPFNRRVWAWDLKDMNYDWIAERVPMPEVREVLLGALKPPEKKYGPNREFWYPIEGGIEALPRAFLRYIPADRLWLNASVISIDASRHEVRLADGRALTYQSLVSTMPLPTLIRLLGDSVSEEIKSCAAALKHNVVHTVNIGLEGIRLGTDRPLHWVYFPEDRTIFHRLSFPHCFSPWMAPPGCSSIQAEISESVHQVRNKDSLISDTLDGLVKVGILTPEEARPVSEGGRVRVAKVVTLDPAYIIYDLQHRNNTEKLDAYLKTISIESRGRFGEWEYFNMDHSILSGSASVRPVPGEGDAHEAG